MLPIKLFSSAKDTFQKFSHWFLPGFILLTTLCLFVPFSPFMPSEGLDASWPYGMNQAVAQGLAIGQDITFTFGPYASIYTQTFHPATDGLMLWGALYLGLSFGAMILILFKNSRWSLQLWLVLFLSSVVHSSDVMHTSDALLFYYPLMVGVYCYQLAAHELASVRAKKYQSAIFVVLLFPIGLLPLIKGSIFILCVAIITLVFALFFLKKNWRYAFLSLLSPVTALMVFWAVSGQAMSGLPSYFTSLFPIISGYTEAMMASNTWAEIALYILVSSRLLWILFHEDKNKISTKIFLLLIFTIALFIAFKGGFVRHDEHAIISGSFLLLAAFLLNTVFYSSGATFVLVISAFVCIAIDIHYLHTNPAKLVRNFVSTYSSTWHGLKLRVMQPERLNSGYKEAVAKLQTEMKFPALQGTTDIYSYGQSYLIASNNIWNPRPTFQSFAAYTPSLVETNKSHLLGSKAPDNLLFKVETIDGRLPSIDDGASWPVILSNYEATSLKDDFLFLRKMGGERSLLGSTTKHASYSLGGIVALPNSDNAIFAKININLNMLGKIANTLYKPSQLQITLNLENGISKSFRFISGMSKTGLLISPLIENTSEFALLYGGIKNLQQKKVESFVIDVVGQPKLWNAKYDVEFLSLDLPKNNSGALLIKNQYH